MSSYRGGPASVDSEGVGKGEGGGVRAICDACEVCEQGATFSYYTAGSGNVG